MGDVNGDGVPDIITAPGGPASSDIRVFDGATGKLIKEFVAYNPYFLGGVFVAAGDVNGDGYADIITGADGGGGPNVTVFSGKDGSVLMNFMAYGQYFIGGVRVAAGDVNGDGKADIITGAGPGGGPHVKVFDGATGALLQSFMAYAPGFSLGVYVASGDINGDGKADIITGAGFGGGPHVKVFDGTNPSNVLDSFMAYNTAFLGGVRVAYLGNVTGSGGGEIIVGAGPGGGPHVQVIDAQTLQPLESFFAYDSLFREGIFVGGN
jgi:hypothetical protein